MVSHAICRVGLDPLMALLSTPPSSPSEPEAILKALLRLQARRGSLRDGLDGEYFGFQLKELARVAAGESDFRSDFREDYAILKQWRAFYLNANPARFHEAPPEVREQRVEEKLGMADRKDAVFSKVALPSLGKTIVAAACHEAVWRGVLTLAAVRLFQAREGRLPKDLAELGSLVPEDLRTDPFTGKPLLYAPAGESFLLYSAGVNCRDDWGRASFLAHEDSYLLAGQADIVFHKP
jgi:hypothetical protein